MTAVAYQSLLAAHLVAVAVFLAGLFLAGALLPGLTAPHARTAAQAQELRRLYAMSRFATTPALVLVWLFGIAMAVEAGWFASGWLKVKLALVVLLSAWHGRQMRALRRAAAGRDPGRARVRSILLPAAAVAAIVVLVAGKPF